jgi:hypothetical protein
VCCAHSSEEELVELFGRCGPIARLVLPPSHTLALVEFTEPQDARMAFKVCVGGGVWGGGVLILLHG